MEVTHTFRGERISFVGVTPSFILSNKKGNYCAWSAQENFSAYCGLHQLIPQGKDWDLFKSIENIQLVDTKTTELINTFSGFVRKSGDATEIFHLSKLNSLFYDVENFHGEIALELDCRYIYDFSSEGRIYEIIHDGDYIVIHYQKFKEDGLINLDYDYFVIIRGFQDVDIKKEWVKKHYMYDKRRGQQGDRWIFDALRFKVKGNLNLVIGFGKTYTKAKEYCDYAYINREQMLSNTNNYYNNLLGKQQLSNKDRIFALRCAMKALDDVCIVRGQEFNLRGIFAGWPWFYQVWTRDEAISLGGLLTTGDYTFVKDVIMRQIIKIIEDGRIPNRHPHAGLGSADGVGWVFKRAGDLIDTLKRENLLGSILRDEQLITIKNQLKKSIDGLLKHHTRNGFAVNSINETWMDTTGTQNDVRDGARIEIQALRLSMYKLMVELCRMTNDKEMKTYKSLYRSLKKNIKTYFFKEGKLYDGLNDPAARPNIFLAYYICKDFLSNEEWHQAFDYALERLWISWGGLSTLDKEHPWFKEWHTGENNDSYHRGDSWFFVNNIAAWCLHDLDAEKYKQTVLKILHASMEDCLRHGFVGHCSEISSAAKMEAFGCWAQAWSASTLVELLMKIS